MISSPQHPLVKRLVALRKDGRRRREEGAFLIEGLRAVRDALAGAACIRRLMLSSNLLGEAAFGELQAAGVRCGCEIVLLSRDCFRKIADVRAPQGAAAEVEIPAHDTHAVLSGDLFAAALRLADPGNLGAIIRTAHAVGAAGVLLTRPCVDPYNAKVVRASAAGLLAVPVLVMDEAEFLEALMRRGVRLIAADASAPVVYTRAKYAPPCCVAVGAEADGLSPRVRSAAAELVRLPMTGNAESLNAAVTAAVLLYEAVRERL